MTPKSIDDEQLELARQKVLDELHDILLRRVATVATAESCTGGLIAAALTDRPGSSAVYAGGVSAYANEAKVKLLGVSAELIKIHGAVSAEVAEAMARGVFQRLGTTYAVSVTGIAGPHGGTEAKPVGTVWVGLAGPSGVRSQVFQLKGSRQQIRNATVHRALAALLVEIKGDEASEAF